MFAVARVQGGRVPGVGGNAPAGHHRLVSMEEKGCDDIMGGRLPAGHQRYKLCWLHLEVGLTRSLTIGFLFVGEVLLGARVLGRMGFLFAGEVLLGARVLGNWLLGS